MKRISKRLVALGLALLAFTANSPAQVVISQVYGGGGNSGAPLKSDFVELHNNGASTVDLTGWSVQYASSAGSSWQRTPLSGSIAPGAYFLVKQADGAGTQPALPAPDAIGTIPMAGGAGKVALSNASAALAGTCPSGVVDLVGYGGANCFEGTGPTAGLTNSTAALRSLDGCQDTGDNAADFNTGAPTPRNRGSATRMCGAARTLLSIGDASVNEGNTGTRSLAFDVVLSRPAGDAGVRFRWSTANVSAVHGEDYAAASDVEGFIAAGSDRVQVFVAVNGDTTAEADETLRVLVTAVTGADGGDVEALGTILNDDFPITPISAIQGDGDRSPLAGRTVATRGIVTGRKSNGFFIQSREVDADASVATSEGLFVFTGTGVPALAQPGRWVIARGTVVEFVPGTDPGAAPLTELGSVSMVAEQDGATYPLPASVALTPDFPSPSGPLNQLERLEGMRVTVAEFAVTAPTGGFTNETQATGSSNGVFHGTVAGLARPFREPGIQAPGVPPAGSTPPIPVWDFNPELISVDSDALGSPTLDMSAGARITGLTGPLDYGFRRYTILPDSTSGAVTQGPAPRAAAVLPEDAFTVAAYNMERFFDEFDGAGTSDVRLSPAAVEKRMAKASLAIREYLRTPDILGVVEMENIAILRRLADRVNADAVAAGGADPRYVAYLEEGNDVGGIDVGFLIKTSEVAAGTPRVDVRSVVQVGKDVTWQQPDGGSDLLNDRPPLALDGVVHYADGRTFPLNVVIVHQRSLNGAETADASGERIRGKRQRQAEFLAAYIDARQKSAPDTRIVVLGDFNAFEFNDGLGDSMNTTIGTPTADAETAVYGDGADLVEPNLVNLGLLEPQSERYSFTFGGNAQTLDHVLVNEDMVVATRHIDLDHARINADFPEIVRGDASSPARLADHDPVVAYFVPRRIADLSVSMATPGDSHTGQTAHFVVDVANAGPEQADRAVVDLELDDEAVLSVLPPAGWECGTIDAPTGTSRLRCRTDSMANATTARFDVAVPVDASMFGRVLAFGAAVSAESWDRNMADNVAAVSTAVVSTADLGSSLTGPGSHLRRGTVGVYRAEVSNAGPDLAIAPQLVIWGDAPAANVAFDAPAGWDCEAAAAADGFQALCSATQLAAGATAEVALRIVGPRRPGQPHFTVQTRASSRGTDQNAANDADRHSAVLTGSWK